MTGNIARFLDEAKDLKVLVVGESILDEFIKVRYEGHSMKSFCPVFKVDETQTADQQEGGALAIANHLKEFVSAVDLISNKPEEIRKTRYIDVNSAQKHVEVNTFSAKPYASDIHYDAYDVVIIADFGHGFCDELQIPDGAHLMCQTNSNNFGFNRVSKWKQVKKRSVCIDLREASLQMNEKVDLRTPEDLNRLYNYELNTEDLYVTLGRTGVIYTNGEVIEQHPAYKTNVVDTIGAGDAFFAFASVMSHLQWPAFERLSIPSMAASLTTTWLANEKHITKEELVKHATELL